MTDTERDATIVRQRGEIAALTARVEAVAFDRDAYKGLYDASVSDRVRLTTERDEAVELLRLGKLSIVTQLDTLIGERDDARALLDGAPC